MRRGGLVAGAVLMTLVVAACSSAAESNQQGSAASSAAQTTAAPSSAAPSATPGSEGADEATLQADEAALASGIAKAANVSEDSLTVACPDEYPNRVGYTFDCGVNDGTKDFTVTLTVTDTQGNVDFEITAEGWPTSVPRSDS